MVCDWEYVPAPSEACMLQVGTRQTGSSGSGHEVGIQSYYNTPQSPLSRLGLRHDAFNSSRGLGGGDEVLRLLNLNST